MTTMQDLVNDTRRLMYGSMTEKINRISVAASAGLEEITLEFDVTGINEGMIVSSGLNVWYVRGTSVIDKKLYVIPGMEGAPEAAVSAGDLVRIKPRVTDWYLFSGLNDEIKSLSAPVNGLYTLKSWTADVDPTYQSYDVPTSASNLLALLRVRYRLPGTPDVWVDLPNQAWRWQTGTGVNRVQLMRNIPVGTEVEFVYKAPFSPATSLSTNVITECGLADSMVDIPPIGVAATLLRTTENRRAQIQTQGDARRADEVPISSNTAAANQMMRYYEARINEEYSRLTARSSIFRGI
jgi:hypothetical protein